MWPISFDCLSIAELLVCARDGKMVLWQRARLEWRLKCATAMKDLKEKAAVNAGYPGDLLAEVLLSQTKV